MRTTTTRRALAGLAAAACGLGLTAAQASASPVLADAQTSGAAGHWSRSVPSPIDVPPGQTLIGDFLGVGVQVYRCTAGTWAFVEPAANLTGWTKRPGNAATTVHFRGSSWESTDDGSLVEARVIASSPVPGSIPQLLLQSTTNRGDGVFGRVSYVQRLNTYGGVAPAGTCKDGHTTGVRYRADYRFFVPAS